MFFLLLALEYGFNDIESSELIKKSTSVINVFKHGGVTRNLSGGKILTPKGEKLFCELCWHKKYRDENDKVSMEIRNKIAHLNDLTQTVSSACLSIEETINKIRMLLAYDRKRKNSVTKSIKELLLTQHDIIIDWKRNLDSPSRDDFKISKVASAKTAHLKNVRLIDRDGQLKKTTLDFNVHSDEMVKWVERLLKFDYSQFANPKCT